MECCANDQNKNLSEITIGQTNIFNWTSVLTSVEHFFRLLCRTVYSIVFVLCNFSSVRQQNECLCNCPVSCPERQKSKWKCEIVWKLCNLCFVPYQQLLTSLYIYQICEWSFVQSPQWVMSIVNNKKITKKNWKSEKILRRQRQIISAKTLSQLNFVCSCFLTSFLHLDA